MRKHYLKQLLMVLLLLCSIIMLSSCNDSNDNNGGNTDNIDNSGNNEPGGDGEDNMGGGNERPIICEKKLFTNPLSNTGFYIDEYGDLYITGRHFYKEPVDNISDTLTPPKFHSNSIYKKFTKIEEVSNIKKAIGTPFFMLILTNDGDLYSWGYDVYKKGYLGLGENYKANVPQQITFPNDVKIKDISAYMNVAVNNGGPNYTKDGNSGFSIALTDDGNIYAWGYNDSGGLGLGKDAVENNIVNTPTLMEDRGEIPNGTNILKIYSGYMFTIVLGDDNFLYGWGKNQQGSSGGCSFGIEDEYTSGLHMCRTNHTFYTPIKLPLPLENIKDFEVGVDRTIAIDKDNTLWTFGNQVTDKPGHVVLTPIKRTLTPDKIIADPDSDATLPTNIKLVAVADDVSLFVTEDNRVYGWGEKKAMTQLANSNIIDISFPVEFTDKHWLDKSIKSISFGNGFTYLQTQDDKFYSFGIFGEMLKDDNGIEYVENTGQLGIGEVSEENFGNDTSTAEMQEIIIDNEK